MEEMEKANVIDIKEVEINDRVNEINLENELNKHKGIDNKIDNTIDNSYEYFNIASKNPKLILNYHRGTIK